MFSIGIDLGQRRDNSAIAIVEVGRPPVSPTSVLAWALPEPETSDDHLVRHLERIPLGTPYPQVVARIVALARKRELAGRCRLVVDATGVGMPVVDMLRDARPGCPLIPVWITAGKAARFDGGVWHVPKLELMSRMQSLFESNQLSIVRRLRESGALVRELVGIRTSPGDSPNHDDLAMALALAVWPRRPAQAGHQPRRLPGI